MPSQFTFKIDNNIHFQCTIKTERCEVIKANGSRCKCKTLIGTPFCYTHLLHGKHLRVKNSTIPNAGKGLFAMLPNNNTNTIVFRKGDTIVEYKGEVINEDTLIQRYDDKTAPYAVQVGKDAYVDCGCKRGVGSIANTSKGHNNATFSVNPRNKTAKLVATKNIKNNEEIFLSYGNSYQFDENVSHSTKPIRKKRGSGIKADLLQAMLSNTYKKPKDQKNNIDNYVRDDSLSGARVAVYHDPNTKHTIISHRGTASIQDVGTDLMLSVGLAGNTKRFKHAKSIQDQTENKYGKENVLTVGHSLASSIASKVGQNSKEIITMDKPVTFQNIGQKIPNNQTDIRTTNDPVSLLYGLQFGQDRIINIKSDTYNPILAHKTNQLEKLNGKFVGNGLKKNNNWINYVKNYQKIHKLSYKDALKQAKDSYRK